MIVGLDVNQKKMRCSQCNKEIKSKYFRMDNYSKVICDTCQIKASKCQVCLLPTQEVFLVDNLKVCVECYSQKYRCKSCSRDLKHGELSFINGLQGFFCHSCVNIRTKCSRCGFPAYTTDKLTHIEEGLSLCDSCKESSIIDEAVGKRVLVNISRILHKKMGLQVVKNLTFRLLTINEILKACDDNLEKAYTVNESGLEPKVLGFTKRDGNKYYIYIRTGQSLSGFISSATHEYARAWQLQYCSRQIGRVLWEGFAEWTAMKMLQLLGYHEEILKIETFGNQHGFGLKKIQVIEKSKGASGVLEFMTQVK